MFKFKRFIAAAALAGAAFGFAGSASAGTFLCTPTPSACTFDGTTGGFANVRAAGTTASDTFSIAFGTAGQVALTFTSAKLLLSSISFGGETFAPVLGKEYLFTLANAGTYDLVVNAANGTTSAASYSGTIDFAAVPEPAMWGMMIGGFAMGGMALRRRRSRVAIA